MDTTTTVFIVLCADCVVVSSGWCTWRSSRTCGFPPPRSALSIHLRRLRFNFGFICLYPQLRFRHISARELPLVLHHDSSSDQNKAFPTSTLPSSTSQADIQK